MEFSDLIFVGFLAMCAWLAAKHDSNGGGGKRKHVTAPG
jgi:hypothetical protein